mmetsp:Transcript_43340/g.77878  ORF Transcript_43340/g.77878 Transcript_43340/m.77878 type:complete len:220 (+) Transcript_43340:1266-1925(+)
MMKPPICGSLLAVASDRAWLFPGACPRSCHSNTRHSVAAGQKSCKASFVDQPGTRSILKQSICMGHFRCNFDLSCGCLNILHRHCSAPSVSASRAHKQCCKTTSSRKTSRNLDHCSTTALQRVQGLGRYQFCQSLSCTKLAALPGSNHKPPHSQTTGLLSKCPRTQGSLQSDTAHAQLEEARSNPMHQAQKGRTPIGVETRSRLQSHFCKMKSCSFPNH